MMLLVTEVRLAVAAAVMFAACVVLSPWREWLAVDARLGLVALITAGGAACLRLGLAVLLAGLAWLDLDGFLIHRYGELSWHGSHDAVRLAVLLVAAVVGTRLGTRDTAERD